MSMQCLHKMNLSTVLLCCAEDSCWAAQPLLRQKKAAPTSAAMSTQNRRQVEVPAAGKQDTARVTSTVDSHAVTKRLQSELMSLMSATDPGVSAFPDGDSLFSWVGTIQGAAETVYEGMSYKLSLKFPTDYPFKSPTVKFETPCFHPNVDQYGNICLDILKDKWSAAYR